MKVVVSADHPNLKLSAIYEGTDAPEIARSFASEMSLFGDVTVSFENTEEVYRAGKLIDKDRLRLEKERTFEINLRLKQNEKAG